MDRDDYNGLNLSHVAIHNSLNRNAGDTLLPQSVRALFDTVGASFGWRLDQVWEEMGRDVVDVLNHSTQGLVIGGGGFIIRDQQGGNTANSGWLWNISLENLAKLQVPVILFAIGYNRFRGQPDFDENFKVHINEVVHKALFVGMRNTGSINKLARYLESDSLKDKLRLQFCPTTVAWQIFPHIAQLALDFEARTRKKPVLAFNFAYDRPSMRFGDMEDQILKRLALVMKCIEESGWDIVLTAHKVIDRAIETYLDNAKVNYATHDLTEATHLEVMKHYAQCDFAIGMRGHGQMIPFGMRRPIISLISHDKMGYFLEDIGHPEWGVELGDENLVETLWQRFKQHAIDEIEETKRQVEDAQNVVWQQSRENVAWIVAQLKSRDGNRLK